MTCRFPIPPEALETLRRKGTETHIAVAGASNDPAKYGNIIVRNLKGKGYTVLPVNPKEERIEGLAVAHTVAELGAALLAACGGGRAVHVPGFVFRLAGLAGVAGAWATGRAALLGWQKACEGVQDGWVCDDARIRAELGYRPRVPLAEGAAATLLWYRRHGWL